MGAFQQWTLKQADDPVFKVYRREYKRRFAWIKAGRISDSEFYSSYIAALGEKLRRARQGMFPCQALRSFSFLLFQSTGIPDPHSMAYHTKKSMFFGVYHYYRSLYRPHCVWYG